ncbi:hypothetical protein Ciccas_005566 [Cichlidogyrus casuarinus]|uniref:G-protein coupled receptors family 1 profile domain-containing protein n=1 Tax=Cichlidogyrus casuarinus TaxID=1844966 RepID=A0ABD2Q8B9_9PLAT
MRKSISVNKVLVLLSICETILGFSQFVVEIGKIQARFVCKELMAPNIEPTRTPWQLLLMPIISGIFVIIADFISSFKNWVSCGITMMRMEAILWPIPHARSVFLLRSTKFFSLFLTVIALIIGFITILRRLNRLYVICFNDLHQRFNVYHKDWVKIKFIYKETYTKMTFIMQALIPWIVIFVTSISILIVLIKASKNLQTKEAVEKKGEVTSPRRSPSLAKTTLVTTNMSKQNRNHSKATRAILIFAMIFTLLEFPKFVICVLFYKGQTKPQLNYIKHISIQVSNFCSMLNSVLNFFVFLIFMPRFKKQFLPWKNKTHNGNDRNRRTSINSQFPTQFSKPELNAFRKTS